MQLGEGSVFAGYRVIRLLGSGGMGEVYLAQHPRLPRRDALKLLPPEWSVDQEYRTRFTREADLASTLWHPHIVGVHDRGEFDGQLWISMDFVDGIDAARLVSDRYPAGAPADEVTRIVAAVASALDAAHKQGLLHRDVKPANIMLTHLDDDGEQRILLTDFGIARNVNDISGLTATNTTVGTVAYSAPEQLMGEDVDGRADQYALAATAYHLLTGTQLFPHSNPAVVISRHLNAPPPKVADLRPDLGALDEVLCIALAKDPKDRFTRCSDFARALNQHASPPRAASASAPTAPSPATPRQAADTASTAPKRAVTPSGRASPSKPPQPRSHNPSPSVATAPRRPRISRRRRIVLVVAVMLTVTVTGLALGRTVIRSNYYVAEHDGAVYIMRGVQGSFLGMPLQQPFRIACLDGHDDLKIIGVDDDHSGCLLLKVGDLRESERTQVTAGLPTGTVDDALRQLKELGQTSLLPICPTANPAAMDKACRVSNGTARVAAAATPPRADPQGGFAAVGGVDASGFVGYPKARCSQGESVAMIGRTTDSVFVVCRKDADSYYCRTVRLRDGFASGAIDGATPVQNGFDVTSTGYGTVIHVRVDGITVLKNGSIINSEVMLEYRDQSR